ncbi:MAG: hypothetical protein HY706_02110 [Candidatus Hydrogenedentes bacterium]|nr:hypothetical protein [Candidatus Hydrogenedentota bacterium]
MPTYDLLQNDATIEYCSGRALTTEDGDWTVGVAVGRCLDMTRSVGAPSRPETIKQPDGFTVRRERWTGWIIERPFCDLDGLIAWVKKQIIEINARVFDAAFVRKVHDLVRRRPD